MKTENKKEKINQACLEMTVESMPLCEQVVPVVVNDCVKSVGNSEDRAVGKLCAYCMLDEVVCLQVDRCRSLIQYKYLGLA